MRSLIALLAGLTMLAALAPSAEAGSRRRCHLVPCTPVCAAPESQPTPIEEPGTKNQEQFGLIRSHSREVHTQTVRECDGTTCRLRTVTVQRSTSEAQRRAEQLAQREQLGHFWAVSSPEGIGMGFSPDQAKAACCYWGQRTPRDIGTAQGASGRWYAVVHYD
jgi:hypothetical protein